MEQETTTTVHRAGDAVIRTEYKCSNKKCGNVDYTKTFPGEAIPPAINCMKCGAGSKLDMGEMLQTGVGMFPTQPTGSIH